MRSLTLAVLFLCTSACAGEPGQYPEPQVIGTSPAPVVSTIPMVEVPETYISSPGSAYEESLSWPAPGSVDLRTPSSIIVNEPDPDPDLESRTRVIVASPLGFTASCLAPLRYVSKRAHQAVRGALRGVRNVGNGILYTTEEAIDSALGGTQDQFVNGQVYIRGE